MKREKTAERKIRGIIIPVDWDDKDNVIGVTIQTADEKEYFIDQNGKGEELIGLIHRKVEVTGKVREGVYGNALINVKRYKLMEASHDEQEVYG